VARFLERENVPVHQNLLLPNQRAARETPRGKLALAVCESCGFVFNRCFEPDKLDYGDGYENTQTFSPTFEEYVSELIEHLVGERGVRNCRVLEVGCGKGFFLRKLVEAPGSGNSGCGFDSSYRGPLVDLEGRLKFEKRQYDSSVANAEADVVVCRHVIEHVPSPLDLLGGMRRAVASSPNGRVFLETPCVEWILENRVFWDFFYEHCSYFTAESLSTAVELSGLRVESVRHVFGGQYLWLEASVAPPGRSPSSSPAEILALAREFGAMETELKKNWERRIRELKGRIALWGAGAKGVTFANLMDGDCQTLACVVDLNPQKQGHYLPGTGHPIVSYRALPEYGVSTAILMNPNYYTESLGLLREAHLDSVSLLSLMSEGGVS